MSAETAINLAFAAFLGLFAFVVWRFCRTPRPKPPRARDVIAAAREIDELELLYSLPAYEAAAALDEGLTRLFEELGPPPSPDPMDAVRDEQTKGDQ